MKTKPVKGTRDYLPSETAIRDYLQEVIKKTYEECGFMHITTPAIEDSSNLDKSDGGENLNLIFRILKRGNKLNSALQSESPDEKNLCDMGLRYDLTLPLSRYFANNRNNLTNPFKVIQIDKVYRAERPQRGRLREFMQCDIDIIGNPSADAEIELILTTAEALKRVGLNEFTVKINDRRILRAIFSHAGFDKDDFEKLSISFDKLDKVGLEGVREELFASDLVTTDKNDCIDRFIGLFKDGIPDIKDISNICDSDCTKSLNHIIETVKKINDGEYDIVFTPSLVRGQGYYTGTIFEIEAKGYSGSVAGGGRYDNLIGKFLNEDIPAVGFSIGFERIFNILMEKEYKIPGIKKRIALFFPEENYVETLLYAKKLRESYIVSVMKKPKKLGKFLNKLEESGYDGFMVFGESEDLKLFEK